MNRRTLKFHLVLLVMLALLAVGTAAQPTRLVQRAIAVTIDDLPVVTTKNDLGVRQQITKDLLRQLRKSKVPAVGFVNEGKVMRDGQADPAEVALLQQWLDAGFELGNHTYSHMSLHDNPLADYLADIEKGDIVIKSLLAPKNQRPRYFRHPYLWTGTSLETKAAVEKYLKDRGYTIAPVTVDNSDYIFARAYDLALDAGDKAAAKKIAAAYVPYIEAKTDYWERQSQKLFNRDINQILLLHANRINSHVFSKIAKMFRNRGYRFLTLEEALKDEAYALPDRFIKRNGISWIHRWALDRGSNLILPNEPQVPEFVMKASGFKSE